MTSRPKLSWEWNGQIQKTDGPEPRLFANPSSGGNDYLVQNGTKAKVRKGIREAGRRANFPVVAQSL